MWRPKEGWNVGDIRLRTHEAGKYADNDLVEAGADAMLNAITLALFEKKLKVMRGKGYLTLVPVE